MPVMIQALAVVMLVIEILAGGSARSEALVWRPSVICENLSRHRKMRNPTLKLRKGESH